MRDELENPPAGHAARRLDSAGHRECYLSVPGCGSHPVRRQSLLWQRCKINLLALGYVPIFPFFSWAFYENCHARMLAALVQDKQGCEPGWRKSSKASRGTAGKTRTKAKSGLKQLKTGREDSHKTLGRKRSHNQSNSC